ncbi:2-hydroxyacid dehydrogenase [Pseudomonas sp. VE 196-7]|uniref:2-hydroxyacid dehydrogenase n=1 Tax=Pseudomonas sp. VE 196-7 TaxID=2956726 RepID=UPI0021D512E8|nr:D-glycerate dehydrogenase [Pseudomonas sp. VE 196-7]MCU7213620.1 D-glycerate dehydrogenase [Pseudomonas sp. VE 196-7]
MKKTILAFSRVSPSLLEPYKNDYDVIIISPELGDMDAQFEAAISNAHGLIGGSRRLGEAELAAAVNLEIVSSISVGYDNYDLDYLNRRGIMLTNTPDVLNETTADLALALILATARRIPELDSWTKEGNWTQTIDASQFGCDVHGKTLGIIGLGKIGEAIARRGRFGFGMTILYSGNSRKPKLEQELGARFVPQEELLSASDFVCPVVPLTDATRNLIGRKELALMGPESILINISRGPVVDQDALIEALQEKTIRAAGLDVYVKEPLTNSELFNLRNVVTVPHIGSATTDTRNAMAKRALENLLMGLEGRRPRDLVSTTK